MRVSGRTRESTVERKVCVDAAKLGVPNVKIKMPGWPDRMYMIIGGRPLFIEFKASGQVPRPLQQHIHIILQGLGYEVLGGCTEYAVAMDAIKQAIERYKQTL